MVLHSVWVHGTSVRPQYIHDRLKDVSGPRWDETLGDVDWSDVNGLPLGIGTKFRGKKSEDVGFGGTRTQFSLKPYWFHFSIPTPVVIGDPTLNRASLLAVFMLWAGAPPVILSAIHVWDGPQRIAILPVNSRPTGLTGTGGFADLVPGVTRFDMPAPMELKFSIGLSAGVMFEDDGDITFISAGANFDIPPYIPPHNHPR